MEAFELKGDQAYKAKDFDSAVEFFGKACGAYSAAHEGHEDPELLFKYGKSLFQVAVKNSSLLNSEAVDKQQLPTSVEGSANFKFAPEEADEEEQEAEQEDADEEEAEKEQNDGEDDEEKDEEDEEEEEEEDDDDDFTAAWKILDLVRVLFHKKLSENPEDKELQAKQAEVYASLGEISIEDDNYPQAAEDFKSALEIKQKLLPKDARELSEAHYMLGLSYEFKGESNEDRELALEHMKSALEIAKVSGADDETVGDLRAKVKELELEVKNGGELNKQEVDDAAQAIGGREAVAGLLTDMLSGAQDISTLVKKRRIASDDKSAKRQA